MVILNRKLSAAPEAELLLGGAEFEMALKRNGRPPEVARPVPPSVAYRLGNIACNLPPITGPQPQESGVAATPRKLSRMGAGSNRASADSQSFPLKSALIPYLVRRIIHGAAIYRRPGGLSRSALR